MSKGTSIRTSTNEVEVKQAATDLQKSKYSLSSIVMSSIDACKKVPQPVRKLIKDRLFYRTARSYVIK